MSDEKEQDEQDENPLNVERTPPPITIRLTESKEIKIKGEKK